MAVEFEELERQRAEAGADPGRLKLGVTEGQQITHVIDSGPGRVLSSGVGDELVWVRWPSGAQTQIRAWEVHFYFDIKEDTNGG